MHNTTKNLLDYAIFKEAEQLDIDDTNNLINIKFLIDGNWENIIDFDKDEFDIFKDIRSLISENIGINNSRFKVNKEKVKNIFNVSALPKNDGERIVLSLEKEEIYPFKLSDLGINHNKLKIIEQSILNPSGLILVTGPVGSGVTTTLYSLINDLNNHQVNISSIENLIEYDLEEVSQTQIDIQNGYTIRDGVHHLVRQNSDIIMVNDTNNNEDLKSILEHSSRGIPIFSSLNTVDVNSTLTNFLQAGIDPMQISKAIDLIISQKLVKDKNNKLRREYDILQMNDDIGSLLKKPRITKSEIKKVVEEMIV